ncbi:MAG: hypothetical protein ABFD16_25140 [Thermoguttaceae bacterium]|jgi:hypothetical protein
MSKATTLNRFPLFGLFACRAARLLGYSDQDARLLGYSTALLYAIYKTKAQAKKKGRPERKEAKEPPEEVKKAKTKAISFGGQEFTVIAGKGKRLKQTVVGNEIHDSDEYDSDVEAKFPDGWHDRLAKAFDEYLEGHSLEELDQLFDLYKAWRDECKVGFNRVDLEKLVAWLKEHR